MAVLPGWDSAKTVEKVHSFFESAETVSLAIAIFLELAGMRRSSDVAWVVLVISDATRQLYGRREKKLSETETKELRGHVAELSERNAVLEQQKRPRALNAEARNTLTALLAQYGKMRVDIIVFDHHIPETLLFADRLTSIFASAGWTIRQWESRKVTYRIPGPSVLVALADGHVTNESVDLAQKLAGALNALDIDCGISLGTFNCKGEFEPGAFHMRFQKPTVMMGFWGVAPFRVQIGAKQFSALPPTKLLIGRPARPVTPPQA
jgi:hypothetical protein